MRYVAYEFHRGTVGPPTIEKNVGMIQAYCNTHGRSFDKSQWKAYKRMIRGYKREWVKLGRKPLKEGNRAMPFAMAVKLMKSVDKSTFNTQAFRTIFTLQWRMMCRVSELLPSTYDSEFRSWDNILFKPSSSKPDTALLFLDKDKTHHSGQRIYRVCVCTCKAGLCGIHELTHYRDMLKRSPRKGERIFAFHNGDGLKPYTIERYNRALKQLIVSSGYEWDNFKSHSLRYGGSTHMALLGIPEWKIARIGGWKPRGAISTNTAVYNKLTPLQVMNQVRSTVVNNIVYRG
jgi:hypothetical protein